MSTAAQGKTQSSAAGYEVARPQGRCCVCNRVIEPAQKLMAALVEASLAFERADCCLECWPRYERKNVVAYWQTTMPRPEQKKKLFVDDSVLCELFERLASVEEPAKLNFRFVLGLILMRKRLVVYETTRFEGDREIWSVRMRGKQEQLDLFNPRLDETQIKDVSQQLGEILQQEL